MLAGPITLSLTSIGAAKAAAFGGGIGMAVGNFLTAAFLWYFVWRQSFAKAIHNRTPPPTR